MRFSRSKWERRLGNCESPIESMFLEQFCAVAVEHGYGIGRSVRVPADVVLRECY